MKKIPCKIKELLFIAVFLFSMGCMEDDFHDIIKEEENLSSTPVSYTVYETEPERTVYFKISDTGQTDIVNEYDDGHYLATPPGYTVIDNVSGTEDDIVIDDVTGLIWTKCGFLESERMNRADDCTGTAGRYTVTAGETLCSDLEYGGHSDWRLPSVSELFSIVTFNSLDPTVDTGIFPNTEGFWYWTSTSSEYYFGTYHYVLFRSNIEETDIIDGTAAGLIGINILNMNVPDKEYFVRCVRGPDDE